MTPRSRSNYTAPIWNKPAQLLCAALVGTSLVSAASAQQISTPVDETEVTETIEISSHFGRNGALTERELEMARTAWSYFVDAYQEETGLVNSVARFPSTTMWDTASYISGLVAAYELGIIDKRTFDDRAMRLLATLRNLPLFRGEAPNKVYNTQTGERVDYTNEPGEIGYSANDIGRLLVWLRVLAERYPYLANAADNVPLRWNFCNMIDERGRIQGTFVGGDGATRYVQEGRLGYEEYAAKGFALWGFDVRGALEAEPLAYSRIYDIDVPHDGRDPRVYRSQNYVLTESYLLDGLELGWDLPTADPDGPGFASQGWRAEFAYRVFAAQERRFEATGVVTARSEHQVEGSPFFVYDTIFADGYAWNTLDPSGEYQPDRAAVSAKAALGMWALWDDPYTDLLFETVADISIADRGFYEGVYENGNGVIPLRTANNNGIILASLLYKAQGPILQYVNDNTRYWHTAFGEEIRETRCLPQPQVIERTCCACNGVEDLTPALAWDEFRFCQPVMREHGIGATNCSPEEQLFEAPAPRVVAPLSCPAPWANQ